MDSTAINTNSLIERINQNQKFQSVDINEWAFTHITPSNEEIKVLELCCGTGKQTQYLLKSFPNAHVACLDVSTEAVDAVKHTFSDYNFKMSFFPMEIDEFFRTNKENFDIIFCSYGLYYSADIQFVLNAIHERLNSNGRLMVMGPYGNNNRQLFDIITKLGVSIPHAVSHSSSTFMYKDVLQFAIEKFKSIHIHTTSNRIEWTTAESVTAYWKNTTFFDQNKEEEFRVLVDEEIKKNGLFVNDKHIMLIEAIA